MPLSSNIPRSGLVEGVTKKDLRGNTLVLDSELLRCGSFESQMVEFPYDVVREHPDKGTTSWVASFTKGCISILRDKIHQA